LKRGLAGVAGGRTGIGFEVGANRIPVVLPEGGT